MTANHKICKAQMAFSHARAVTDVVMAGPALLDFLKCSPWSSRIQPGDKVTRLVFAVEIHAANNGSPKSRRSCRLDHHCLLGLVGLYQCQRGFAHGGRR